VKTIILAGGLGTRLQEVTETIPKPMVSIGERPIIWHIMKRYSMYGFKEFCIALGYKGRHIKEFFLSYCSDVSIDLSKRRIIAAQRPMEDWIVHLVETGRETQTGGRIKRLKPAIGNETFMATYGDGLGDIDLAALLAFHRNHGKLATVTAVTPPAKFGALELQDDNFVTGFFEKSPHHESFVSGGFFVLEPEVFDYIDGDQTAFEREPLTRLAHEGQLMAFRHHGYWECMDTLRDAKHLNALWASGSAPWKIWNE
jgi:glucose-1-phosphate cytidylyltransferase